jgi:hypothetical protein
VTFPEILRAFPLENATAPSFEFIASLESGTYDWMRYSGVRCEIDPAFTNLAASPGRLRIATSKFRVLASSFGLMIACCRCEELNIETESSKGNGEIHAE